MKTQLMKHSRVEFSFYTVGQTALYAELSAVNAAALNLLPVTIPRVLKLNVLSEWAFLCYIYWLHILIYGMLHKAGTMYIVVVADDQNS